MINYTLATLANGTLEVHRTGCSDLKRGKVQTWTIDADGSHEAVDKQIAEFEEDDQIFNRSDFKIIGCAFTKETK